jgi:hypothetical protein
LWSLYIPSRDRGTQLDFIGRPYSVLGLAVVSGCLHD